MSRKELVGLRFGRWAVTAEGRKDRNGNRQLECQCDCGTVRLVPIGALTAGRSASCGCLSAEMTAQRRVTHGLSGSKTHNIWVDMKARCLNKQHPAFHRYGGRGIKVCERWMTFENFLADMGECPEGLSLERGRNNDGYDLSNCTLATAKEQANNRRSNRVFSINGEMLNIKQISTKYGVPYDRLRARLLNLNWAPERAIT
jgi:hypothetical protein